MTDIIAAIDDTLETLDDYTNSQPGGDAMRWSPDLPEENRPRGLPLQRQQEAVPFDTVTINLRRIAAQHRISGQLLDDMRIESRQDHISFMLDQMVFALKTQVQTVNLPPETVTETGTTSFAAPTTWWQHLKHALGQNKGFGWINRRWPTRMATEERTLAVTVNLRRFHVYPDAPSIPRDGYQFVVPNHTLWSTATWIDREEQ